MRAGESVGIVGVPGEGSAERNHLRLLLIPTPPGPCEGFFVLFLVGYPSLCSVDYVSKKLGTSLTLLSAGFPLCLLGQCPEALPGQDTLLHRPESAQPPVSGDDPVAEEVLQLSYELHLVSQMFGELLQGLLIFAGQEDLLREQTVLERVQAYGGLPLRRPEPGTLAGVAAVSSVFLSLVIS